MHRGIGRSGGFSTLVRGPRGRSVMEFGGFLGVVSWTLRANNADCGMLRDHRRTQYSGHFVDTLN